MKYAYKGECCGNEWPENIDKLGQRAATPEANSEEFERMHALSAAFSSAPHSLCNLVAVMKR